jgi:hypothetical protein
MYAISSSVSRHAEITGTSCRVVLRMLGSG